MVLVIGAGPAGLAMAYELGRRGVPCRVVERAGIGEAWRNHYDRLHLHTLKQVSALPGLPMPADYPPFPSAQQFADYLQGYARHFGLNVTCGVDVEDARWDGERWELVTNHGTLTASTLVAATGIWSTPVMPPLPGLDQFRGTMLHSSQYRNAAPFAGQRVLVVGVGNSGSEIAVDLGEHGVETTIAVRDGATFVPFPRSALAMRLWAWLLRHLPRTAGEWLLHRVRRDYRDIGLPLPSQPLIESYPVVGFGLPEAVATGQVARRLGVRQIEPTGVVFDDGTGAAFDSIVLATGFRPTLDFAADHVELDARGRPRVDEHWRSLRNPQLVCVGYWYPATEGWLQALPRVAAQAAAGIATARAASPELFSASASS